MCISEHGPGNFSISESGTWALCARSAESRATGSQGTAGPWQRWEEPGTGLCGEGGLGVTWPPAPGYPHWPLGGHVQLPSPLRLPRTMVMLQARLLRADVLQPMLGQHVHRACWGEPHNAARGCP